MNPAYVIRVFMCIMGVLILNWVISSLARKRLTDSFAIIWGLLAMIFIIGGIMLQPEMIKSYISIAGIVLIIVAVLCVVGGMFIISVRTSDVTRRNAELAIDVSLLHEECDRLKEELDQLKEESGKRE